MRVVGNEHYYAGEGQILRSREWEKAPRIRGADEGRWFNTNHVGEVTDPGRRDKTIPCPSPAGAGEGGEAG